MLLWHCADNNSYQGCALPEKEEFVDEDPTQKNYLNNDEENPLPSKGVECDQESWQGEYPEPNKDEDEWSDGWKD